MTRRSWSTRVLGPSSAAALGLFGLAAVRGWLDGLRIDAPLEVAPVALAAAALVVAVTARRSRRWWTRTLPALVAGVVVIEWAAAWYLRASATIVDPYPASFLVWVGLALLTPAAVVAGWSAAGRGRRLAGAAGRARWPWPPPSCSSTATTGTGPPWVTCWAIRFPAR